uniref:SRR1-like domain-containing protein n=1 Tax=Leersia perrieri TaxID=77586 RepID=A0A0D9W8R7_9ORYZ
MAETDATQEQPPPHPAHATRPMEAATDHEEERPQDSPGSPHGGPCSSPHLIMEEFVMGDHARLSSFLRLAMGLAPSSPLFAKLSALFASDAACLEALARVRGGAAGGERLRVVAYRLGGMQYSWAPRFRLAVLLLLRDRFPGLVDAVEVVDPTVAPVERRAMEELGCIVTASPSLCLVVDEPTLIFMPYADRVFFENLLILNWSPDRLGKIVLLGHSFSAMVKMLEPSISKQEKCGVTDQREKVRRVLAVQSYVQEMELCAEISGNCGTRVWSNVNVLMNYNAQLEGWHLNPSDAYIEDKHLQEAESIVKEIHETISDVRGSALYTKFLDHVKNDQSICARISSILGAHECIQLVIYGLGSFEFDVKSQYQVAFALLLKVDNIFPIGDIEIFDPALSPADVKACFDLGLRVILVNEQCQRSVDKPTIFFVPGLKFVGHLIESNFTPEQLNKMILISYGFKNSGESISAELENGSCGYTSMNGSLALERDRFLWASINYISEVIVMENFNEEFWGVSELRFEFLDVAADVDMNSNLPRLALKEKFFLNFELELEYNSFFVFDYVSYFRMHLEERMSRPFKEDQGDCMDDKPQFWGPEFWHRIPAMHRKTWSPPPKGWIKLNFHGTGCSKDRSAGMGVVLHNDEGALSYFTGSLEVMLEHHEPVKKLIIEGDDLTVIHWCNKISKPPARALDSFMHSYWYMDLMPCKGAVVPADSSKGSDNENDSSSLDASPVKPINDCNSESDKLENADPLQVAPPTEPPNDSNRENGKDENDNSLQDASPAELSEGCNDGNGSLQDASHAKLSKVCNNGNGSLQDASPDELSEVCNNGNGQDKDECSSPSSEFVIPPGWAQREYIAWHVDRSANQTAINLARIGTRLPDHGIMLHLSTHCDCEHGREMKNGRPDITW